MKTQCMKYIMRLQPLVLLVVMAGVLSGCAGVMHQWGYSCIKTPVVTPCSTSPVLITNLSEDLSKQRLLLPSGQVCQESPYAN